MKNVFLVLLIILIPCTSLAKDKKIVLKDGYVVAVHDADQDITIEEHYPEADEIATIPEDTPMTGWASNDGTLDPTPDPRSGVSSTVLDKLEAKERGKKFKRKAQLKDAIKEAKDAGDTEAEEALQEELDELETLTLKVKP